MGTSRKRVRKGVEPVAGSVPPSGAKDATTRALIGARITEARGRWKQDQFADLLGVHKNTLGRYERGVHPPAAEFVNAMSDRADVNPSWLLRGEGPRSALQARGLRPHPSWLERGISLGSGGQVIDLMEALRTSLEKKGVDVAALLAKEDVDIAALTGIPWSEHRVEQRAAPYQAEQRRIGYVYLPLYALRAAAGARGALVESETPVSELAFREDFIRNELRAAPNDLMLLHVEGDSGEPDLRAGDIIMVDRADTSARREGFYVIRMDEALLVKQIQRLPGGVLKLISRNATYEPILLPLPSIQPGGPHAIIGRVVWACRRF